jgi:hypothetical protein
MIRRAEGSSGKRKGEIMRRPITLAVVMIAAMLLSGCGDDADTGVTSGKLSKWIGQNVRVQFRRDALGAAAALPISPETGEINGAATTLIGPLLEASGDSIVIGNHQRKESQRWIPREVILFVELNP